MLASPVFAFAATLLVPDVPVVAAPPVLVRTPVLSNIGLEDAAELACMAPDELAACEAGSEDIGVVEYVTLMLEYGADPMAPYCAVGVA